MVIRVIKTYEAPLNTSCLELNPSFNPFELQLLLHSAQVVVVGVSISVNEDTEFSDIARRHGDHQ